MLKICTDLNTQDPTIKEYITNKNADKIKEIAQTAKKDGFDYLVLNATDLENEADSLVFLVDATQDIGIDYLVEIADVNAYEPVLKAIKKPGIINPKKLTLKTADEIFGILKDLDEGWDVLFTNLSKQGNVSEDVETMKGLISRAEQDGLMPPLLYIEPITAPLLKVNRAFPKMKRVVDAFTNIYPDINFMVDLPIVADGLKDEATLMNVFIGMAHMIGVNAFAFSTKHKSHMLAIRAAEALLNDEGIQDFQK